VPETEETGQPGELPDDPVTDPADEERRRAAVDAALLGTSDETLGDHVERLIAIGRKVWELDRHIAEELAQEALTRVLEHRRRWDPRKGDLYQFLKGVLRSLADEYFESGPLKYEVHLQRLPEKGGGHDLETDPESNIDEYENLPDPAAGSAGYSQNALQMLIARESWAQDKADFVVVTRQFAEDVDAMSVIRAAQKDIRDAEAQAVYAKTPVKRIYRARARITLFLRAMYKARSEKPRLERVPVRPTRPAGEARKSVENSTDLPDSSDSSDSTDEDES
jgi:DNA-directed RNA polymerase specialized sigma24 family protein